MAKFRVILKMVEGEPEVILTPETMLMLRGIGEYLAAENEALVDEVAQFAAALSIFRRALGGQGVFHEKELADLVFNHNFFKGLACCVADKKIEVKYNEDKELVFRIREEAEQA